MPRVHIMRRGLGQDDSGSFITDFSVPGSPATTPSTIYDPVTGTYGPSLPAVDNPVGGTGPQPTFASTGYNVPDVANTANPIQTPQGTLIPGATPAQLAAAAAAQAAANVIPAVTSGVSGRGPSPTVQVPLSSSSFGLWLENSNFIPGVPNWLSALGIFALVSTIGGAAFGAGRYRVARRK